MNKSLKLVGLLLILGAMLPLAPLKGAVEERVREELKRRGSGAISLPLERNIGGRDTGLVGESERAAQAEYRGRIEKATSKIQDVITELLEVNEQVEAARAAAPKKRKRWSVRLPGRRRSSAAETEAVAANLANLETQLGLLKRELNELNLAKIALLNSAQKAIQSARAEDNANLKQAHQSENIATIKATSTGFEDDWGTRDWDDNRDNWDNWLRSEHLATANPQGQGAGDFFTLLKKAVQEEEARKASQSLSGSGSASPDGSRSSSPTGELRSTAAPSLTVSTSTSTSSLPREGSDAASKPRGSLRLNPSVARRVRSKRLPAVPGPPRPKSERRKSSRAPAAPSQNDALDRARIEELEREIADLQKKINLRSVSQFGSRGAGQAMHDVYADRMKELIEVKQAEINALLAKHDFGN